MHAVYLLHALSKCQSSITRQEGGKKGIKKSIVPWLFGSCQHFQPSVFFFPSYSPSVCGRGIPRLNREHTLPAIRQMPLNYQQKSREIVQRLCKQVELPHFVQQWLLLSREHVRQLVCEGRTLLRNTHVSKTHYIMLQTDLLLRHTVPSECERIYMNDIFHLVEEMVTVFQQYSRGWCLDGPSSSQSGGFLTDNPLNISQ